MTTDRPDRLSIVVQSGAFDRVHYALVLAAAAAAVGTPVTLFFTMGGARALAGAGADGHPGWHGLGRDEAGREPAAADAHLTARRIGGFEELLEGCVALGVRFLVCESGLLAIDLSPADLRPDVPVEVTGAVSFLAGITADGATFHV